MNLANLPVELLDKILDYYLHHWNTTDGVHLLNIRLVCKIFNTILSRLAFRELDFDRLACVNIPCESTLQWLLHSRLSLEGKVVYAVNTPSGSAVGRGEETCLTFNDVVDYESPDYIRFACLLATKYQGRIEICEWLRGSQSGSLHRHLIRGGLSVLAFRGNLASIAPLISQGSDLNAQDPWLGPPIYAAAYNKNLAVIKYLLDHGADPNVYGYWGTPLHVALLSENDVLFRLLCQCDNVKANTPDKHGHTVFWWACFLGHLDAVHILLEHRDTDPNSKGSGHSPLAVAVGEGHESIVRLLLNRDDIIPDINTNYCQKYLDVLREMERGRDSKIIIAGFSPLSLAVHSKNEGMVRLLLARKDVNPNIEGPGSHCPLTIAANSGQIRMVKMLLEREDIEINETTTDTRSPLSFAAAAGHEDVVRLLLERDDLILDRQDQSGSTALLWACKNGHDSIVRLLLERQSSVIDVRDNGGYTCLIEATRSGHIDIVQTLLDFNADSHLTDRRSRTALWWARKQRHGKIEKLLLQHREKPSVMMV